MPYQVSWQSVSIKSQRPVHVLGAALAADTPQQAPAAARIVAAKIPSFVMTAPCPNFWIIVTWKMSVARHIPTLAERFRSSGVRATAVLNGMVDRPRRSEVKAQAMARAEQT